MLESISLSPTKLGILEI